MLAVDGLTYLFRKSSSATQHHKPTHTDQHIADEDVRKNVHWPRRYRINAADCGNHQQSNGGCRECNISSTQYAGPLQISRRREGNQKVTSEKSECAEGAGVVKGVENVELENHGQNCRGQEDKYCHHGDGDVRSLILVVRATDRAMKNAEPSHRIKDARARIHAGQRQRIETQHRPGRDWHLEPADFHHVGEHVEWCVDLIESRLIARETQDLGVGDKYEEYPGKEQTNDDCSRNSLQRIPCLFAKSGRTLKPDEAEDGDDHAQADSRE